MLFRLLFEFLQVLLLLVVDLLQLLGTRLKDAKLLFNRVDFLEGRSQFSPPEAFHLVEGVDKAGKFVLTWVPEERFDFNLQLGRLEMTDQVCRGLAKFYRRALSFLGQELIVQRHHLSVWAHITAGALKCLFEVCVLVEKWTHLCAEGVH